ncbi:MAG: HrcA family transcriptional regulator, partial [Myxococcota bacterium]
LQRCAFELGLRALPLPEMDVVVEGTFRLAKQPEFADLEALQSVLQAIGTKQTLLELLDRIFDSRDVTVMLGSEHHVSSVGYLACVGGSWVSESGNEAAAISLMGPPRMDYGRLVPLVRYATEIFGRYKART